MKTVVENVKLNNLKLSCNVKDCNDKYRCTGYCQKHYIRFLKYGDPLKGGPFKKKYTKILTKICIVEGCNNPKHRRGYCNSHYKRLWRHGDPLKGRIPKIGCNVENCKNKHNSQGYCKLHFYRKLYGTPMNQEKQIKDSSRICLIFDCDKKHYCKGYCRVHYSKLTRKSKSWKHNDLKLWITMNKVRERDNYKCQWYNCKKEPVHVHHIFPVNEYPELKYVEKYMICYCRFHHKEWHKKRGDVCAKLIVVVS